MVSKTDRLKAELKLAEAEERFVAKKADGKLTKKDRDDLRDVRADYRANYRKPVTDGAAPQPASNQAKVGGN